MTGWLEGRRALVVGGGSGIGRAVAETYAAEGAQVAVLEKASAKCDELAGALPGVVVTEGDATSATDCARAVGAAVDAFGGLDTLVSCVGVFDYYRSIVDLDADILGPAFEEIMSTNVLSCLYAVRAALEPLQDSGSGVVLLTESTSAYQPGRGGVLYVASKFAVRGLVTALAHDLAPDVRVNGVAPGGTLGTDLRGLSTLGLQERSLGSSPDRADDLAGRVPLHVALDAEDHAWSYVYLASNRARGITGRTVHSDGGAGVGGAPRKRS